MTTLKKDSQKAQALVNAYGYALKAHGRRDIREAYGRVSGAKVSAWNRCVDLCSENNGEGLTVVSTNTFVFTAAFKFAKNGKDYLCYITPSYNYEIEL